MSELTEEHLAVLTRQAADLLDPHLPVSVTRENYGGGRYWKVGIGSFGSQLDTTLEPFEALERIIDDLSNDSSEGELTWGKAFPPCLHGHVHPADVRTDDRDVLLVCPVDGTVVSRIAPADAP